MNEITIKDVAELCGKSEKTVRTWIDKILPEKIKPGIKTLLSVNDVDKILRTVFGDTFTDIVIRQVQNEQVQNEQVQNMSMDMVIAMATEMKNQHLRLSNLEEKVEKQQLQIEAPEYYTIIGWKNMNPGIYSGSEKSLGKRASRLSRQQYHDIKSVPDDRWGVVGSYHIDILEQL